MTMNYVYRYSIMLCKYRLCYSCAHKIYLLVVHASVLVSSQQGAGC